MLAGPGIAPLRIGFVWSPDVHCISSTLPPAQGLYERIGDATLSCCRRSPDAETVPRVKGGVDSSLVKSGPHCRNETIPSKTIPIYPEEERARGLTPPHHVVQNGGHRTQVPDVAPKKTETPWRKGSVLEALMVTSRYRGVTMLSTRTSPWAKCVDGLKPASDGMTTSPARRKPKKYVHAAAHSMEASCRFS